MLGAGAREITYAGPGLLVGSRLLSRLGLLSSSAFLQGLLSFTLICLECKFEGFPLAPGALSTALHGALRP